MTEATDVKLLQDYEALRRREVECMTELLDVLPRITNYDMERVGQVRDAMFHADHPYLMMFVGAFNAGKSSLINALLGSEDVLRVGSTPTTDRISILRYGETHQMGASVGTVDTVYYPSSFLGKVSFVDTPGLESIFKKHEETTSKFLHRADVVLFVMLATQAMTQSNLEMLQRFKEYGTKVILVINQVDLLSAEDAQQVQQYVREQSKTRLGFTPEVWMVSAKFGRDAWQTGERDPELWRKSGLHHVENYIQSQLSDANRLRQKLKTPLQIAQGAHQLALDTLRNNQATFDQHRTLMDNVERQLEGQKQDLLKLARQTANDVGASFNGVIERARIALNEAFRFTNGLRAFGSGILEMTYLARIFRLGKRKSFIEETFEKHKVYEPFDEAMNMVGRLPSRIEGQDQKDLVDLATYGQKAFADLHPDLRAKMIGSIAPPASYNRTFLANLRQPLEEIVDSIKSEEAQWLEDRRRDWLIVIATWQLVVLVLFLALVAVFSALNASSDAPVGWFAAGALVLASILGFLTLPIRGQWMHGLYAKRLDAHQARHESAFLKATDAHIAYALELRRETISPLTRLVEAQVALQDKQMSQLKNAEQSLVKLENDLSALGKRNILGMKL